MFLILTVQPVENGHYRFGMNQATMHDVLPDLAGQNIYIDLPNAGITEVQGQTFFGSGNLISNEISNWIIDMGYEQYPNNSPTKLVFKLENNVFRYYPYQANWPQIM